MKQNRTSTYEAQVAADRQSDSATVPLQEKVFSCRGKEVDILSLVKKNHLSPDEVESICNLPLGGYQPVRIQSRLMVLKRTQ